MDFGRELGRKAIRSCSWLLALVMGQGAVGAAAAAPSVPTELQPWIPWVLESVPDRECPTLLGRRACVWVGPLRLEVTDAGGQFQQAITLDSDAPAPLPGGGRYWPESVTVDGKPTVVVERGGLPWVLLTSGSHRLLGKWAWSAIPEYFDVPEQTHVIELQRSGKKVGAPERTNPRQIKLAAAESSAEEARVEVAVFRRIEDAVPMRVVTRVELDVAGQPRELRLATPLLRGSNAEAVTGDLSARWDDQGGLILALAAGKRAIEITAHLLPEQAPLERPALVAPWPEQETWVFQAAPELRDANLEGAQGIDPSRTSLPEGWRQLPAYLVGAGDHVRLQSTRRGQAEVGRNLLHLSRQLWLDLDGGGFSFADRLSGELRGDMRLDLEVGTLGRVDVDGEPRLITRSPSTGLSGVELRRPELQVEAQGRLTAGAPLPAVGWSEDVQSLSTALALPPGWELLGASGVDSARGSWVDDWDLWDFFFIVLLCLAAAQVTRRAAGAILLLTLVLLHGRADAPHWAWVWLLSCVALVRALPAGRLRQVVQLTGWVTAAGFLAVVLPFCLAEVRSSLYPQLDHDQAFGSFVSFGQDMEQAKALPEAVREMAPAAPEEAQAWADSGEGGIAGRFKAGGGARGAAAAVPTLASDVVVQTGAAQPTWHWRTLTLGWSGPVQRTQVFRLFLLPPWATSLVALLRVLGCLAMGAVLLRGLARGGLRGPPGGPKAPGAFAKAIAPAPKAADDGDTLRPPVRLSRCSGGTWREQPRIGGALAQRLGRAIIAGGSAILVLLLANPGAAQPSAQLLDELRTRLTQPAPCAPNCVSVPSARLEAKGTALAVTLEVDVAARAALPLPGPAMRWLFSEVEVDGRSHAALAMLEDGRVYARLEPGRRTVKVSGAVFGDEVVLDFGQVPHRLSLALDGWDAQGLDGDGKLVGSLRLQRKVRVDEPAGAPLAGQHLPAWFELERVLSLGEQWTVQTTLRRRSPVGGAALVQIPVLSGETVVDSQIKAESGIITVALGPEQVERSWTSRLLVSSELALSAPEGVPWTERWQLQCGLMWHCTPSGLPPIERFVAAGAGREWQPRYFPWPGETLRVGMALTQRAEGEATTLDAVQWTARPGARLAGHELTLRLRSSAAYRLPVSLPPQAAVERLLVDGVERPMPTRAGDPVELVLEPGAHALELAWQQPAVRGLKFGMPELVLPLAAHNVQTTIAVPEGRWLLWAGGPSWGPAILFWRYVVLALLLAPLLARLPHSPLVGWQWSVLGLGFAGQSVWMGMLAFLWLWAVAWRRVHVPTARWAYNLGQVALGIGTVVALAQFGGAAYSGLVVQPDMQVAGAGSSNHELAWYVDRITSAPATLPTPWTLSVPLWVYRGLMLLWALWLATSLVRWLKTAFDVFTAGPLWRPPPKPVAAQPTVSSTGEGPKSP